MFRKMMVLTAQLLAAGAAAAAGPPTSPAGRPDFDLPVEGAVVTDPDWLGKPDAEEVSNAFPKLAQVMGLSGRAAVRCAVSAQGALQRCEVLAETPKGLGFGEAALSLTPSFRMKPQTVDGVANDRGEVTIPISFRASAMPPPAPEPAPLEGSPAEAGAVALAGTLMELTRLDSSRDDFLATIAAQLGALGAQTPQSPEERVAIDTLTQAAREYAAAQARREQERLARTLSRRQMSDLIAFFHGAAGQAWLAQTHAARWEEEKAGQDHGAAVLDAARRRFCAAVACLDAPAPK